MIKHGGVWYDIQLKPPGSLGYRDNASPDNPRLSLETPGPTGINDPTSGAVLNPEEVLLRKIDESTTDMLNAEQEVVDAVMLDLGSEKVGTAWSRLDGCFRRHYEHIEQYVKDFYRGDDSRIHTRQLEWLETVRQQLGAAEDPRDSEVLAAVENIQMLVLKKAYDFYVKIPTKQTLIRVLILAEEASRYTPEAELPDEVTALMNELAKKRANQTVGERLAEDRARWLSNLTKDVPPADPVKLSWLRSRNTGI